VPLAVPLAVPRRRSRSALPGPGSAAEPIGPRNSSWRAPQAVGGQLCRCQVDAESDGAVARVWCGVEGVELQLRHTDEVVAAGKP